MLRKIIEQPPPAHQNLGLAENLANLGGQIIR
jgi:hypothetical protein